MSFDLKKVAGVLALVVVAVLAGLAISSLVFTRSNRVCRGVSVGGIDISGKSKSEATQALRELARSRMNSKIRIKVDDRQWAANAADMGVQVNWKRPLDSAMQVGRRGNIIRKLTEMLSGPSKSKEFDLVVNFKKKVLDKTVDKMASAIDRPAKNATINVSGGSFVVIPEHNGIKLDTEAAANAITEAITDGKELLELKPVLDQPRISAKALRNIDTLLARYTTTFSPSKVDRSHNLRVASNNLNKTVLLPGEEFSYNAAVGERTLSTGFKNAIIFVQGLMEDGVGGGICQVSSTLYNAVLLAGLDITERHRHSRTVVYVPYGRDATVAYGSRDLKFKNNGTQPIYITETISGGKLTASIYGSSADKKTVTVYTGETRYVPVTGQKVVIDKTIPVGTKKVIDKGSRGVSTVVYRKIIDQAGKTTVEVVSRDKYPVQNIIVATNPAPPAKIAAQPKPEQEVN